MSDCVCKRYGEKDSGGNCTVLGTDNLPVQCVGPWAEHKYYFLDRYLTATSEVRKKFLPRNVVFIDLFSGPGLCVIKEDGKEINGGGIRASQQKIPFSEYHFCDIYEGNIQSLRQRLKGGESCYFYIGDSNVKIDTLVQRLLQKNRRYHVAYLDPFAPRQMKFETIRKLSELKRIDLFIHFPIGSIKRNLKTWLKEEEGILDDFLGTHDWRSQINGLKNEEQIYQMLLRIYKEQLIAIGFPENGLRIRSSLSELPVASVKNTKKVELYALILASKHPLAQKIWNSILEIDPSGQRHLFVL